MNFKAVFALLKTARSAQTQKSKSFTWIVWSTLYVYLCPKIFFLFAFKKSFIWIRFKLYLILSIIWYRSVVVFHWIILTHLRYATDFKTASNLLFFEFESILIQMKSIYEVTFEILQINELIFFKLFSNNTLLSTILQINIQAWNTCTIFIKLHIWNYSNTLS